MSENMRANGQCVHGKSWGVCQETPCVRAACVIHDLQAALRPFVQAYYTKAHMGSGLRLKAENGFAPEIIDNGVAALSLWQLGCAFHGRPCDGNCGR